jgi:hypothetical protein
MTEFDPNAIINPSSGLYGRNPTHVDIAKTARDQEELAKAVREAGASNVPIVYDYRNVDLKNPPPLMGITKIRNMSLEEATGFCKSMLRSKPNITKLHIKLGEYPRTQRIENGKIRALNSTQPRYYSEIGEKVADILTDKSMLIVELLYVVHATEPFSASAVAYGTNQTDYSNNELFGPLIELDYIKLT